MGLNNIIVFENWVDKISSKILPRISNFSRVATGYIGYSMNFKKRIFETGGSNSYEAFGS
jgi:hypothetical protein